MRNEISTSVTMIVEVAESGVRSIGVARLIITGTLYEKLG